MHLVIISGAARPRERSNTAKIIAAFRKGYEESGHTTETWYLSDRRQWANAAKAFAEHDNLLIALPLYVENIPGILLEFLEGLSPKAVPGTKLAFCSRAAFPRRPRAGAVKSSWKRCLRSWAAPMPGRCSRATCSALA